jgi:hypothetical protein
MYVCTVCLTNGSFETLPIHKAVIENPGTLLETSADRERGREMMNGGKAKCMTPWALAEHSNQSMNRKFLK